MTALASQIPETLFRREGLIRVQPSLQAHASMSELMTDRLRALPAGEQTELNSLLRHALSLSVARRWAELAERLHQCMFVTTDDLVRAALHAATTWPSALSHPEGTLLKVPREVLAQRVGCTRVTISRALARLVDGGQVRLEGRRILLLGHQGRGCAA